MKSSPNDRFFEKLFMAIFTLTLKVFGGNLLRESRRRNTGFKPNKPTHYLLDYGDITIHLPLTNTLTFYHVLFVQSGRGPTKILLRK